MEAYGVDSFPAKKKKGCAVKNASAVPFDPFNPSSGRELAHLSRPKDIEGFVGSEKMDDQATYRARAGDYSAYCKSHGICSPVEGFQGSQQNTTSSASTNGWIGEAWSPEIKAQMNQALKASLDSEVPKQNIPNPMPQRKVDMSSVEGYVDEELDAYLSVSAMNSMPSTSNGQTWSDGTTAAPKTPIKEQQDTPDWVTQAKTIANKEVAPPQQPRQKAMVDLNKSRPSNWNNIMDIMLFVFFGIMLIFLCEQLYRLAAYYGMRQTITMLEPMFDMLQEHIKEKTKMN